MEATELLLRLAQLGLQSSQPNGNEGGFFFSDTPWFTQSRSGLTTTVYFQYGTTTSYGHTTPMQSQTGNMYRNIAANINGLSRHTTYYHFRIVATNSGGTRYGGDRTFTTL